MDSISFCPADYCESDESPNAVNINENHDQLIETNSASANAGDESSSLPAMGPYDLGALRTSFSCGTLSDQDKYKVLKQFDKPHAWVPCSFRRWAVETISGLLVCELPLVSNSKLKMVGTVHRFRRCCG